MSAHAAPREISRSARHPVPAAIVSDRTSWMQALEEGRETLRATGAVLHFSQDREVFAQGTSAEVFYKVVSGVVRTCKFLSDGRRQIEAFHIAGDVFGFEHGDVHPLSAEAVSDCNLISYRRRNVEAAAMHDQTLSRQLFAFAMHSVVGAQQHALLLGRRCAAEKVAIFLLEFSARANDAAAIVLPMTRQDIADYLGLTIETVSRTLSQMERGRLIEIPNARQIVLKNRDALEAITI